MGLVLRFLVLGLVLHKCTANFVSASPARDMLAYRAYKDESRPYDTKHYSNGAISLLYRCSKRPTRVLECILAGDLRKFVGFKGVQGQSEFVKGALWIGVSVAQG